jgi:hypothetical protein
MTDQMPHSKRLKSASSPAQITPPGQLSTSFYFAFHSLRAKLTKIDVTANTSRSSPRV